nr:hypothetical protein [Tanacetum cinerariifolium]
GKGKSATKADTKIDWGSKDDSHQSNDEHVNEGDITWLTTDEEEKGNEYDDDKDDDRNKIVAEQLEEEKDVKESSFVFKLCKFDAWFKVDHSTVFSESIKSQVPPAVNEYLGSSLGDSLQKTKGRTRKVIQPSNKSSAFKESSKGKTPPKTSKSGKSVITEEPDEEHLHDMSLDVKENIVDEMGNADEQPNDKITKAVLVGPVYNILKDTCQSSIELEYNMEECYKALSNRLDWTNPEGDIYPYDLSNPLPLKGHPSHLTIHTEHFFNNDLEYLKSKNIERKYTKLITKTKDTRYELVRIEDMISKQWSTVKVGYNKDVAFKISHWGPKRQLFYRSQINRIFKHDVYSTVKILSVVRVKVDRKFSYGYLEEIVVRRADR